MSINSICPTCSRRLPVDSKVCPRCSSRLFPQSLRKFKVKWRMRSGRWFTKTVVGLLLAQKVENLFRTQSVLDSLGVVDKDSRSSPTLHTVWNSYHKVMLDSNKKSLSDDAQRFRDYLAPRLGNLPINRIRPEDIEAALEGMRQAGKSPATRRLVFALLRMLFNWSTRRQLFRGPNPCSMVQSPRVDNARGRVLTTEEAERLLQSLKTTPNRHFSVVIRFLLFTGKRRGEVRRLEWSDIDLKAGTAVIRGETTKTGKTHHSPL